MENSRTKEKIKYITAVVLYGTIGMFLRYVDLPSELVAMFRGIIGVVFILCYLKARHQPVDLQAIKNNLGLLIGSGICLGMNWYFLFKAYVQTTVAIASLCNYLAPMIVVLVAPLILRERLRVSKLPCVLAAFMGIILVSGVLGGPVGQVSGIIMGLLAAVCFVGIVICNRKMHKISPYDKAAVQLLVSALTICPFVLTGYDLTALDWNARSVLIVLLIGIVQTGIAYCLYFSGMSTLPVQTVAILGYLEPVVSVLCSVIFLMERMDVLGWLGAALILGAAIVSEKLGRDAQN